MTYLRFGVSRVVGPTAVLVVLAAWPGAGCARRPLEPGGQGRPIDIVGGGGAGGGPGGGGGTSPSGPLFVAVAAHGVIVTSRDAIEWTARPMSADLDFASVAAGPSRLVVVGGGGVIATSRDGIAWELAKSPSTSDLRHVIYTGDRFVAVGESWTLGSVVLVSPDGVAWTTIASPSEYMFHAIIHNRDTLIAAASYRSDLATPMLFLSARDGVWNPLKGPDFYASIDVEGTILLAGNGPMVTTSKDNGAFWQSYTVDSTGGVVTGLAFDGATYVAVGFRGGLFTSPDTQTWTRREDPMGTTNYYYAVAHGGGTVVAVGFGGKIVTSSDGGVTWTARTPATTEPLVSVAYGPTP
jgi:photosystem II stability/assembly factor-like uncharacterized protein